MHLSNQLSGINAVSTTSDNSFLIIYTPIVVHVRVSSVKNIFISIDLCILNMFYYILRMHTAEIKSFITCECYIKLYFATMHLEPFAHC